MHLQQALKKSKRQIVIGWVLSIVTFIILIMSCILSLYYLTLGANAFDEPFNKITLAIYQNTQLFGLKYLWKIAPIIHYPEIFTAKNLGFATIVCLLILGVIIRDCGINLAKRIGKVKNKVEEDLWEQSLKKEPPQQNNFKPIIIEIKNNEKWYKRPFGIISMTVIAGYIVNLLNKFSGFQ